MTRRAVATIAVALALAAGGCGGGGGGGSGDGADDSVNVGPGSGGDMLAAADVERVLRAQRSISACRETPQSRRVERATGTLVDIYRDNPDQIFNYGGSTRIGRDMTQVLEETRTRLERCGATTAVSRIDSALDEPTS